MKHTIHKHKELLQDLTIEGNNATNGFAVKIDDQIKKEAFTDEHFRSDYIIMCLVNSGNLTISLDLKKFHIPANGFIFASPNNLKQFLHASENSRVTLVSFTGDFLNNIGISTLKPELFEYFSSQLSPYWQLDKQAADLVRTLVLDLERRNHAAKIHPFGKELLFSSFQTFLYEVAGLSKIYSEPVSAYVSRKENLVIEFLQLAQKHISKHRTVIAYAEMLSLTPKYLTETVKEITGKNAGEMIDDLVMLEAKYLLNNPSLSIGQITDLLNFSDQSFFGKFFKRHQGISPKAYRKSL